jgi:hypothetical protein
MQEHQENYNDSKATASPDMRGDGYSNVGRKFSPAWGGQFQEGGEIPMAQNGKKKPLYVESKNDPRYRAYQDSLSLHNYGKTIPHKFPDEKPVSKKDFIKKNNIEKTFKYYDIKGDEFEKDSKSKKNKPFKNYYKEKKISPNYKENVEKAKQEIINMSFEPSFNEKKLYTDGKYRGNKEYINDKDYGQMEYDPVTGTSIQRIYFDGELQKESGVVSSNKIKPIGVTYSAYDNPLVYNMIQRNNEKVENKTFGLHISPYYKKPTTPVIVNKGKYNPNEPRLLDLQKRLENTLLKPQQQVIVKPTTTKETTKPKPKYWTEKDIPADNWKKFIKQHPGAIGMDPNNVDKDGYHLPIYADKKRPKVEQVIINPQSKGLVQGDTNINADVSGLRPEVKRAKYFDVRDVVNQNFGGSDTSYKYYPENGPLQELAPEPYNTRTITPRYQMGGDVYPVNYVPQAAMGGSIPGSVGFTYARTKGIPSEGPYAKKTLASAQNGVDMYGNPITAELKYDQSVNRTNYNPRTNQIIFGNDMPLFISQEERDKTLAHENRHAWQFANDRTNFDIIHNPDYAFQERLKKKPEFPSTEDVFNEYHNRKQKEVELDVNRFKVNNPELSFMPDQLIYKKFVDSQQYNNPRSIEGEAQYYQNTGNRSFQNGGEMRYYQNGLDWKPKGMKDGGWLDGYEKAQEGERVLPNNNNRALQILTDIQKRKQGKGKPSTEFSKIKIKDDREETVKKADNTRTASKPKVTDIKKLNVRNKTKAELAEQERKADEAIAAKRKEVREKADANPLNQGLGVFNSENQTRQNWEDSTAGLESKFRVSDKPNVFDDWINPASWVGRMAANLGAAPNQIVQQDSMMPLVSSIAEPVLGGAIGEVVGPYISRASKAITTPIKEAVSPFIKKTTSSNIPEYMSLEAPKGNMYGENQVLTQQQRLLNPDIKAKFFENQAPEFIPSQPKNSLLNFEKTPKDFGNRITPKNYEDFVNRVHGSTDYDFAASASKKPENLGIGNYNMPGKVFKDAPLNDLGKDIINAHEKNHGIFAGTLSKEMQESLLKPFGTKQAVPHYAGKHQADEVLARMGQFKNALGMGDNQTFTLGHLNLIRKNYANSFLDNSITEMLAKIKPGSAGEKEFLKNMNKYAFGTGTLVTAGALEQQKEGGVIKDDRGQWDHPGEITEISGDTMATHGYGDIPLYVVPDKGKPRMVQPNTGIQKFPGAKKFTEYPMAKNGMRQEQKGLVNLDNLLNFTNYNTKQPGGWLDTL